MLFRSSDQKGMGLNDLAFHLGVDPLELESIMEGLVELDWVGLLAEEESRTPRFVLLIDPSKTSVMPLVNYFLLPEDRMPLLLKASWQDARLDRVLDGFSPFVRA